MEWCLYPNLRYGGKMSVMECATCQTAMTVSKCDAMCHCCCLMTTFLSITYLPINEHCPSHSMSGGLIHCSIALQVWLCFLEALSVTLTALILSNRCCLRHWHQQMLLLEHETTKVLDVRCACPCHPFNTFPSIPCLSRILPPPCWC